MQIRQTLLLTVVLLFLGCGVMSNPSEEGDATADADNPTVANGELKSVLASSLYQLLLDDAYPSYKVISTKTAQMALEKELNTTLPMSINYQQNNLFAYPLTMQQGCAIKESLSIDNNTSTITLQADETACSQSPTNYLLFYNINKSIQTIMIDKFDEENVTILNTNKL